MATAWKWRAELRATPHTPQPVAAYENDWKDFDGWCRSKSYESLPAHPETIALYLSHQVLLRKVSALERRCGGFIGRAARRFRACLRRRFVRTSGHYFGYGPVVAEVT